jgi:hypothetical protein
MHSSIVFSLSTAENTNLFLTAVSNTDVTLHRVTWVDLLPLRRDLHFPSHVVKYEYKLAKRSALMMRFTELSSITPCLLLRRVTSRLVQHCLVGELGEACHLEVESTSGPN